MRGSPLGQFVIPLVLFLIPPIPAGFVRAGELDGPKSREKPYVPPPKIEFSQRNMRDGNDVLPSEPGPIAIGPYFLNGVHVDKTAWLSIDSPSATLPAKGGKDRRLSFRYTTGELAIGDKLPVFDGLYEVSKFDKEANSIVLRRTTDGGSPGFEKVSKTGMVFPIGADLQFSIAAGRPPKGEMFIRKTSLDSANKSPTAHVRLGSFFDFDPPRRNDMQQACYYANVIAGDSVPLFFDDLSFRVKQIVPPDAEKKFSGWVELDLESGKSGTTPKNDDKK